MAKPTGYIVLLSDVKDGGIYQMVCGPDPEREGALTPSDFPTLFATRADAQHAIKISKQWAKLRALQEPDIDHEGDDWTPKGLTPVVQAVYAQEPTNAQQ